MQLILILFIGWCWTTIIVNGAIFDQPRRYFLVKMPFIGKLLSCVQCTGFWVGLVIFSPLLYQDFPEFNIYPVRWANYLIYPALQSGSSVILESFIIWLVKREKTKGEE